jgi:glycosyltransferase involved in cell wall biosynthesis
VKVLYIHQYFKTPDEGGAIRSYYLAKGLVDNGYEVEMITAHNKKNYEQKCIDGIKVHYLPVYYDNSLGFSNRIMAFLKFIKLAIQKASQIKDIDFCYATSTPLTVGWIAYQIKKKLHIPYYFEVRDLWPEAPIQVGAIKNPLLKKVLYLLERKIYLRSEKIIALSPGMRDGIKNAVPHKSVYIIPNMSDCSFFKMENKNTNLEEKFKVTNKFVITYFGAAGRINKLEHLLELAKTYKKEKSKVAFLIAAKGSELSRLKKITETESLTNVHFIPFQNKAGLKELLNITDAVYISFDQQPILQTNSPNKFFDGLAAGKLCIVNTKGWLKNLVEEHECGLYGKPSRPQELKRALAPYIKNKELLHKAQLNARMLAEAHFSKDLQIEKLIQVFKPEHKVTIDSSVYILTA